LRNKKVLDWEEIYKPEVCEEIAGYNDELYIHYDATREDDSKFGSLVDNNPPYRPFSMSDKGTFVPALDYALPGMCLGERRMVVVPPRLGWMGGHHDSIMVELVLFKINGKEAAKSAPEGPHKTEL
jgi:FKBP-type peptidyl-prolyl cis-trans isomerase 2